jgi:hypothetical protein
MARQNISPIAKNNINKQKLTKQLELISQNIAKKGLYFSAKNQHNMFDIVDAKTQKPVICNVLIHEIAQLCASRLNKSPQAKLKNNIEHINRNLKEYQPDIEKYYNDIYFYKHTLSTTADETQYFIVETRLDVATQRMSNIVRKLRGIFS